MRNLERFPACPFFFYSPSPQSPHCNYSRGSIEYFRPDCYSSVEVFSPRLPAENFFLILFLFIDIFRKASVIFHRCCVFVFVLFFLSFPGALWLLRSWFRVTSFLKLLLEVREDNLHSEILYSNITFF